MKGAEKWNMLNIELRQLKSNQLLTLLLNGQRYTVRHTQFDDYKKTDTHDQLLSSVVSDDVLPQAIDSLSPQGGSQPSELSAYGDDCPTGKCES